MHIQYRGQKISKLFFADDIDGLAGDQELADLVDHLDQSSGKYGTHGN